MSLIQHDDRVLADIRVNETLSLKHAVSHVFDTGLRAGAVLKTDCIPDFLAQTTTDLFRDTFSDGHGSNTPGLGATDSAIVGVASLSEVLCHLCGLA